MEDMLALMRERMKLQADKYSEIDQFNKYQEEKFMKYINAAEDLMQKSSSSYDDLELQVKELRKEMSSLRSAKDEESAALQTLLIEQKQKAELLKRRLKIEEERSQSQAVELASIRSSKQEQRAKYQKRSMEQKLKIKELSDGNERLQELLHARTTSRLNIDNGEMCNTSIRGQVSRAAPELTQTTRRTRGRRMNEFLA